ncbi:MONOGALACTOSYLDIACYLGLYCEROL SYNTHASE 1 CHLOROPLASTIC [Salix purpurea]|uniref:MONOGALACTOSYLDIACYLGLYCEROL SYNTHASE 1 CHLOROPLASTIC n=1 Tax=Salix purpurea TaxID=77065 RepID=A0A9Q0ZF82_SALPP|nr:MONOGALACTOSYLDIACYLGLYCEROL SYNTHASE 1 CHLOROPLASTIC [Salix purpurea]
MSQVFITDLWSEHTPWPFNQLPRSYNFLVKHKALWKMTYYGTAPRVIHQSNFAATSTFIARWDFLSSLHIYLLVIFPGATSAFVLSLDGKKKHSQL